MQYVVYVRAFALSYVIIMYVFTYKQAHKFSKFPRRSVSALPGKGLKEVFSYETSLPAASTRGMIMAWQDQVLIEKCVSVQLLFE
jgi:hypothetical protein